MNSVGKFIDHRCTGCNCCSAACAKEALKVEKDDNGFWYPSIKADKCVGCGLCLKACPIYGAEKKSDFLEPDAFAGWCLDEDIRRGSSSGGIFTAIASRMILEQGAIVYGAAYASNFMVEHIRISTVDGLKRLRGSKYVQSYISPEIYRAVIADIKAGNIVLFSGTPCQTAAVNSLVSQTADRWKGNLFTIDLLCHGVPSPKAWEKYLLEVCDSKQASLIGVNMRDKSFGWHRFHVRFDFDDGTMYDESFHEGVWGPAFFTNLFFRECCYECNFKKKIRQADITLGDFWGAAREEELRKYDDNDKGTSVIFVNSEKGAEIIRRLQDCWIVKIPYECLVKGCYVLYRSSDRNYFREKAFKELDERIFSEIVREAVHPTLMQKLKRKLWRIHLHNQKMRSFGGQK